MFHVKRRTRPQRGGFGADNRLCAAAIMQHSAPYDVIVVGGGPAGTEAAAAAARLGARVALVSFDPTLIGTMSCNPEIGGLDRKSVVSGKSVAVSVDLGGGRHIKKKKKIAKH